MRPWPSLALVVLLGGGQGAQGFVPVGFEVVGDQAVVGVDGHVAAARRFGGVAGPLDVLAAQRVGLVGAALELGLDGEGDLEGERGDGGEQQLADGGVDASPGTLWQMRAAVFDALLAGRCTRGT